MLRSLAESSLAIQEHTVCLQYCNIQLLSECVCNYYKNFNNTVRVYDTLLIIHSTIIGALPI